MCTTAGVLAAGLLVMGLCPFDFVTTSPALHASLARSRWSLFGLGADQGPAGFAAADMSAIGVAGIFLALGFFLALGWREQRHPRYRAGAASMLHLALLAIMIELVQIFVVSRSFDLRDALLNVLGGALGIYLAIWAVDGPSRSAWLTRPAVLLHPLLVGPALALQVAHHLLSAVAWTGASTSLAAGSVVLWVPFSGYYGRSLTWVAGQVLSVWVGFALLALTVTLLARGLGRRACWWAAAGTVLAVAAGVELIQFTQPGRIADVTDPLLALTGALIVVWACRYLGMDGLKLSRPSTS